MTVDQGGVEDIQGELDRADWFIDMGNRKLSVSDLNLHRVAFMLKKVIFFWDRFAKMLELGQKHGGVITPSLRRALIANIKSYKKELLVTGQSLKAEPSPGFSDIPKKVAHMLGSANVFLRKVKDSDVRSCSELASSLKLMMDDSIRYYHGSVFHRRPVNALNHARESAIRRLAA